MNTQIILLAVIVVVILIDFVLRGIKKNKVKDEVKKIGKDNMFSFKYFIRRKRNIITFVLLSVILKPVFVFLISPNFIEFIDYEQKIERDSFMKNKVDLFNTFVSTATNMYGHKKALLLKKFPILSKDGLEIINYIDTIIPTHNFKFVGGTRTTQAPNIFRFDYSPPKAMSKGVTCYI